AGGGIAKGHVVNEINLERSLFSRPSKYAQPWGMRLPSSRLKVLTPRLQSLTLVICFNSRHMEEKKRSEA
ncbi:MAG: hypothetical protein QGG61_08900, partial [Arenicellales bacterium]|nr:hypothetical protein [Arenicellales bacterium]